jgi:hypothetical protein
MLKLGIFKKEQLTPGELKGFFKSRKFIALDLYNSLDGLPRAERDKIQERMLSRFSVQSGILKYTHARRFEDFDALSLSAITANLSPGKSVRVHDIGASDGRTSCDFYNLLTRQYGERLSFSASDFAPYVYVLRKERGSARLIVDDSNHVLQIITPPFVFIVVRPESKALYPLNHLIRHLASAFYARPLLTAYLAGSRGIERTRVDLLCQECHELIADTGNFSFNSYDVLSGPTGLYDIIRAMNVLNHGYFSEAQLKKALNNIILSLNDGGLFITGSNTSQGTVVNGAIYKKTGGRMQKLETSGDGSQVHALITDVHGVTEELAAMVVKD